MLVDALPADGDEVLGDPLVAWGLATPEALHPDEDRPSSVNALDDVLQLKDIAPPRIGPEEVLLRVRAAGVDFGVWHLMAGFPYAVRLVMGLRRPRNPVRGIEVAGVVEALGPKVTFKLGDEVFGVCDGSFAELARASQDKVAHKPANLTFEQAAVVPISATAALHGLRAAEVEVGQKVLIIGAGGGAKSRRSSIAATP